MSVLGNHKVVRGTKPLLSLLLSCLPLHNESVGFARVQRTAMAPEYNVTGLDYHDRRHFRYAGPPLFDVHAHVTVTRPPDAPEDAPGSLDQAESMLEVAV